MIMKVHIIILHKSVSNIKPQNLVMLYGLRVVKSQDCACMCDIVVL